MKSMVPKIRFKGLTNPYFNQKIKEMGDIITGYTPSRFDLKLWNGDLNWISAQDFKSKYIEKTIEHISSSECIKSRIVKKDSVIVTCIASIGLNAIVKKECITNQQINAIICNDSINNEYLYYLLEKNNKRLYNSAASTAVPIISKKDFEKFDYYICEKSEQTKIGRVFAYIDKIIADMEDKIGKFKEIKKTMLYKMFPQNGKKVPEIRLKGFKGEWEEKPIEKLATFLIGKGLSWNDIDVNGKYECILYGNLYTDYGMIATNVKYKTSNIQANFILSKYGDVLIPSSDTTPTGLARATSIERENVVLGGGINIIRPKDNIDGSCLSLAINVKRNELLKLIKGSTVRHIYNHDIKQITISLPKDLEEQKKIVDVSKKYDNIISESEQKLDKLKELKKTLLNKMFV